MLRWPVLLVAVALATGVLIAVAVFGGERDAVPRRIQPAPPAPPPAAAPAAPAPRPAPRRSRAADLWATYGYDARRTRFAPGIALRPPFRRVWTFRGGSLLEFPPAIADGRLFLPTFDGRFYALDAATGKIIWRHSSGRCGWASPAVAGGVVFETFLNRSSLCDARTNALGGELVAFTASTGRIRWRRPLGPTESSPLVHRGAVFVGDWLGRMHAVDARTGRIRWSRQTGGPVKGSPAGDGGRVYVGAYDNRVYAFAARSGSELWASGPGTRGAFYSTPAVAYGRVYIGSTDGSVYAFGAGRGKLLWSRPAGGYVYASPAVWRGRVLIGSYDASFYALDAATGGELWRFRANGPISGSATVLDGVVYFSTLRERTYALDARTGKELWTWPDGKYSPVVADRGRLYLVGYSRLYGMVES